MSKKKKNTKKRLTKIIVNIVFLVVLIVVGWFFEDGGFIEFSSGKGFDKIDNKISINNEILTSGNFLENLDKSITGEFISSPSKDGLEKRLKIVKQTENRLHGRLYNLTLDEVKDLWIEKAKGGTDVKIILENNRYSQYTNTFREFQKEAEGSSLQLVNDYKLGVNYTHAKTFLTDKNSIIQTANLTYSSFFKNIEHFFITTNTGIYNNLEVLFQKDWDGNSILQNEIHSNLLVCPIDCKSKLLSFLNSANSSIKMYQQYITDDDIFSILKQEEGEGVDLKIKLPKKSRNELMQARFKKGTISIQKKPYIHSKAILVDDKYLLIGSMNMSTNSLERNREIGIITTDERVIREFLNKF